MRKMIPLLLVVACTSTPETRGVVKTMPAHGADGAYVPSEPIGGARVELRCPDASPRHLGDTDAGGRFEHKGERLPRACSIWISRSGYATRAIPVAELCADPGVSDSCDYASVTARLVPKEQPR
jgi:hypothetical protein